MITLGFSSKEANTHAVRATLVITSFGITTTAAVFAIRGSLSLSHAMVVVALLTQSLFLVQLIEPWIVRSPSLFLAQQVRFPIYIALAIWLAVKTPCLGSDSQCNLCTRAFTWFWATRATNPWRRSGILYTISFVVTGWLDMIFWLYGPVHYLRTLAAVVSEKKKEAWIYAIDESKRDLKTWRALQPRTNVLAKFYLWYEDETTLHDGFRKGYWKTTPTKVQDQKSFVNLIRDARIAVRIRRVQRSVLALIVAAIFTYDAEKVVQLNLQDNANDWGYGQIAAMILIGPSVAGVIQLFVSSWKTEEYVSSLVVKVPHMLISS